MTPGKQKPGKQKGGALLMVLWMSAALAAIGLSVATRVRSETARVSTTADTLRAWYLASGSVERAIQWMLWSADFPSNFWNPRKTRLFFTYASGDVVVETFPESAKLNINRGSYDDILRVVAAVSGNVMQAREITDAIMDWRGGAAGSMYDQYYASIGPSMGAPTFRARHASFQEIEELLLVRGMTPELYYGNYVSDSQGRLYPSGGLRDCLSVWGSTGPFDANGVSPALMQAVGMSPQDAARIVARRQIAPFGTMGDVAAVGVATPRLTVGPATPDGVIWTIRATARLRRPDGTPSDVVQSASATVKLMDPRMYPNMPVRILRWYDDGWSESAIAPPAPVLPPPPVEAAQ
jgi:general secretion pathway protein K